MKNRRENKEINSEIEVTGILGMHTIRKILIRVKGRGHKDYDFHILFVIFFYINFFCTYNIYM